jgi:hypothetical protein
MSWEARTFPTAAELVRDFRPMELHIEEGEDGHEWYVITMENGWEIHAQGPVVLVESEGHA